MTNNMKKITALTSAVAIAIFVFFTNTSQAEFVAGKNYMVLDKPVETETGDQVEVRELFCIFVLIASLFIQSLKNGCRQWTAQLN